MGFSLGLIGGGGSILAVPLFLYVVGLSALPDSAHIAIGTTALAVGLNAFINSYMHLRKRNIEPRVGVIFATVGLVGSLLGAYVGHLTPGTSLLTYFATAMIALGIYVAVHKERAQPGKDGSRGSTSLTTTVAAKTAAVGFAVGFLSGYFGIGGGFLIVPSLMYAAGLPITRAIGTSLISVGTFGIAAGAVYWYYGKVNPLISALYVLGGVTGGYLGTSLAVKAPKDALRKAYGGVIIAVGMYMLYKIYG